MRVVKVGNIGTVFAITIKDAETGAVVNLTGATITFYAKLNNRNMTFAGSIISAAAGTCSFTTVAGNLDAQGTFYYEAKVVIGGSTFTSERKSEEIQANLYG